MKYWGLEEENPGFLSRRGSGVSLVNEKIAITHALSRCRVPGVSQGH